MRSYRNDMKLKRMGIHATRQLLCHTNFDQIKRLRNVCITEDSLKQKL